jgi:transposase-like protein
MDEKLRFVYEYERDEEPMKALCQRFEISRETGYVWLRRYRQNGPEGLVALNRAPCRHPNQTPVAIEAAVLGLRQAHMTWGRTDFWLFLAQNRRRKWSFRGLWPAEKFSSL